jgi:hypothetical protein
MWRSLRLDFECHIWVCSSKIHILFAATRSAGVTRKHIFIAPCSRFSGFSGFAGGLGLGHSHYSYSQLILRIALALLRGKKTTVFVPHISLAIADRAGVRLLWLLKYLGLLHFYDDGMTAISSQTILHQSGFLPHTAYLDAWNYHWRSPSRIGRFVDLSLAHRSLVRTFPGIDLPCIDAADMSVHDCDVKPLISSESGITTTIILASKWLDYDALNAELSRSRTDISDVIYIPHYNDKKNSETLMATCRVQRCYFPELFLARLFEMQRCRLFFGVTSTSIYLCELLHRRELAPFKPIFIGNRSLANEEQRAGEWDDYFKILSSFYGLE